MAKNAKVKAFKYGRMDRSMKATGKMTNLMDLVVLSMQTVTTTMETGIMIWLRALGHTVITKDQNMSEAGKMTSKMALALKFGLMVLSLKVRSKMDKNTVMVSLNGPMVLTTSAILLRTRFKAMEFTNGMMEDTTKGNGKITT